MHELSICEAIVRTVDARAGGRPVRRVDVRIGHLRQVVPDSLQFSWKLLTEGSDLDGCELVIEHVAAIVHCAACDLDTTLEWPVLVCRSCESHDVKLLSGEEFQLASLDVAEQVL